MNNDPFMTPVPGYDNVFEVDGDALLEATYDRHPELIGYIPASTCCRGCKAEDIAEDLGRPASDAWENLYWFGLLPNDGCSV